MTNITNSAKNKKKSSFNSYFTQIRKLIPSNFSEFQACFEVRK